MQNNTPIKAYQFFNREHHCEDLDQCKKPKKKNDRYHRRGKKIGGKKLSKSSLYLGV
jgi:hypothetical protein